MNNSKSFLLTLTLCLGASTAHAEMSFVEKLRADHTAQKYSTAEKLAITQAKSNLHAGVSFASLVTLAGCYFKARRNHTVGKPLGLPYKAAAAAALGALVVHMKWGKDVGDQVKLLELQQNEEEQELRDQREREKKAAAQEYNALVGATFDAPAEPADLSTPALIIAESKKVINELATKQQPLLPAPAVTKDNMKFAFFGKPFNDRVQHLVKHINALPELTAELTRLLEQERVAWNELSELAQASVLLARIGQQKVIALQQLYKIGDFSYDQVSAKLTSGIICTEHMQLLFYPLANSLRLYKKLEKTIPAAELTALFSVEGNPFLARVKQPIPLAQPYWRHTPEGRLAEGQRLILAVQNCDGQDATEYDAYFGKKLAEELMGFINSPPFETVQPNATLAWENLSEMTQVKVTLYHAFSQLLVQTQLSTAARDDIVHWRQVLLDREPGIDTLYNRLKATTPRCFTPEGNQHLPQQ